MNEFVKGEGWWVVSQPRISKYYTVTNVYAAFDSLQAPIPHITVYYICIHKLMTFRNIKVVFVCASV